MKSSLFRRTRKLRMAMIGGGEGAFIGEIHRMAAALSGDIELVAGAFSSDPEVSKRTGQALFLDASRVYPSFDQMLETEARLSADKRVDLIAIVTPNHLHYAAVSQAIQAGFHVMCDKPLTHKLEDAHLLQGQIEAGAQCFALSHAYLGYPLVTQARLMVAAGEFGKIRKVHVEYPQGWLSTEVENLGSRQADWRTDPERSGISGCMGDIGSHAHNLAEYISGERVQEVSAQLHTFIEGRRLDDDGNARLRMSGGVVGLLSASQVCAGEENALKISVYGESGSCEWQQQQPNSLIVRSEGHPLAVYRAGSNCEYLYPQVRNSFRTPSGHPEGFIEAFANIYKSFADQIWKNLGESEQVSRVPVCPGIDEGVRGMEFILALVKSSNAQGQWIDVAHLSQRADCTLV